MSGELVTKPEPRQLATGEYVSDLHLTNGGLTALIDHGLIWALNTYALHPRGFEIRTDGLIVTIAGHGRHVIQWAAEQADAADRRMRQYEQTLNHCRSLNNPGYWDGNSPGFGGKRQDPEQQRQAVAAKRRAGRRVGG